MSINILYDMGYKAKRISRGHYLYRGLEVICVGYYHPEHRICWEAKDKDGRGFVHGYSLKETKVWIDEILDDRCE